MKTTNLAPAQNLSATEDNTPNASKLLSSLRHLDYSSASAISDIIDNSIDAEASIIRIKLISEGKKNIHRIEVWDNGCGMDASVLDQAMRLGSDTDKNPQYDLGRYGMGLVTASISIGERLEVTTLQDGTTYRAVQDLEDIRAANRFIKQMSQLDSAPAEFFRAALQSETNRDAETGTCVVIENIDRWDWILTHVSERNLVETLGQAFRKFISAGKKIYLNDIEVKPIDPIHDLEPSLLADEAIDVEGEKISLKLYELKDFGNAINVEKKLNIAGQGFYILRNNREIATAQTLGLFSKHNDFNLFRAEFSYPGSLDHLLNAGFTKQNINPELNQSIYDQLKAKCAPHIKQIRTKAKKRQIDNREKREDFSEIEKYITQKAHLLKTPVSQIEKRDPKKNTTDKPKQPPAVTHAPRLDITKRKQVDLASVKVNFRTKSMGKVGPLYDAEMEKDITVIYWNVEHPFYTDFIIPHEDNKDVFNPIGFLIYSLASAELRCKPTTDSEQIIENIRADLSQNLRVLMNS